MQAVLGVLLFLVVLGAGIASLVLGFMGIEHSIGAGWAYAAVAVAVFLKFTLPITVGIFFGARDVLHWHWALALLVAAPGLLLMIPGMIGGIVGLVRR